MRRMAVCHPFSERGKERSRSRHAAMAALQLCPRRSSHKKTQLHLNERRFVSRCDHQAMSAVYVFSCSWRSVSNNFNCQRCSFPQCTATLCEGSHRGFVPVCSRQCEPPVVRRAYGRSRSGHGRSCARCANLGSRYSHAYHRGADRPWRRGGTGRRTIARSSTTRLCYTRASLPLLRGDQPVRRR